MRLFSSYAPDWILTIILAAAFYFLKKVAGFKREFSVSDTSLRFPYAVHERVTSLALFFIAFVAPLVLQWVINILTTRTLWDAHNSALGLVLSLSLAGVVTQVVKVTVGRTRPDILDRCRPDSGTTDPPFGLSSVAICHQSDQSLLNDGFMSFPSGHSSLSFAGLAFLSLYVAGKLHLFDSRGHMLKAWLSVIPLFGAALVAISRTMDYRHHWEDVVAGSFLGILTAYFSYRLYYPYLSSELAHLPYGPRMHRPGVSLPIQDHPDELRERCRSTAPWNGDEERPYNAGPGLGAPVWKWPLSIAKNHHLPEHN
ncbi:phosphatidic acid phosphatase type 2/haloperoxidase [Lactarius quietus]|nr:phosphatidic acid phosphatase type 2/haloperoxidase [Lactarius quietus]